MATRKRVVISNTRAPRVSRKETSPYSSSEKNPRRKSVQPAPPKRYPKQQVSSYDVAERAGNTNFFRGFPTSEYEENATGNLQESERFSWEEGQGDFIPLTYYPTKTSWPGNDFDHRRTEAAGYDRSKGLLRVKFFTDGAIYDYGTSTPVPPYIAFQFRNYYSPGRFINSTLENFGYQRVN